MTRAILSLVAAALVCLVDTAPAQTADPWPVIAPYFRAPAGFENQYGRLNLLLTSYDGRPVRMPDGWKERREEIRDTWMRVMGPWPELLTRPKWRELKREARGNVVQCTVELEVAPGVLQNGYLLLPSGRPPFPAVFVPYYEPETSVGLKGEGRDFALQLARRGFVTLAIGSPGGDALKPLLGEARCQPLSYLAYIAANCHTLLSQLGSVDPRRIGVVGHSYGGKWAMFASCLYEKFACAAWSDGGVAFDETIPGANYWEPWYLGKDPVRSRRPGMGLVTPDNPRTGAYRELIENGHSLLELQALMAPRPFLVSGGNIDHPARWPLLDSVVSLNRLLGHENRVAMTNRPRHQPTIESNEILYRFFEHFLGRPTNN